MAATDLVAPLAETPERPIVTLTATLGAGDDFESVLERAGVSNDDTVGWSTSPGRPPPPSAKNTVGNFRRSITSNNRSFLRCPSVPWVPASTV